jgi:hypothetical protein
MDYSIFRFNAVVDFIEVEIHTAAPALAGKIKKACALTRVDALDKGAGNYATVFKIKLHDPGNFAEFKAAVARIERAYPLTCPQRSQ